VVCRQDVMGAKLASMRTPVRRPLTENEPPTMSGAERDLRVLALHAGHRSLGSLAGAAGIDRHVIGEWMRGETTPRRAPLGRLARALRIEVHVLGRAFALAREARAERSAGT